MEVKRPQNGTVVLIVQRSTTMNPIWPIVKSHGYVVIGPCATADEARDCVTDVRPSVALLDYWSLGPTGDALLSRLEAMKVAVCLLLEPQREKIPDRYTKFPTLLEPVQATELLVMLGHAVYSH